MFRSTVTAEPAPVDVVVPADLIPLSVLTLDLPEPSGGWVAYLASRDLEVMTDDIGRPAITRADARQLILEKQEGEARAREVAERNERNAIELDQQFRARLWQGQPWYETPMGVSPAEAWAQAEKDAQPKRTSPLQEALSNSGGLVYHPLPSAPNEAS
jgi:hypothetical protein